MSISTDFQRLTAAVRQAKSQVANLADLAERTLWRSLEWGKPEEIAENAKKYEALRQKDEMLDDGIRHCQDVSANLNLIFTGKASEKLVNKYYKLAALSRVVSSPEFDRFVKKHPPAKRYQVHVEPLETQDVPTYIRQYMKENKVSQEIKDKVCAKFPLPEEELNQYVQPTKHHNSVPEISYIPPPQANGPSPIPQPVVYPSFDVPQQPPMKEYPTPPNVGFVSYPSFPNDQPHNP